MVQIPGQLALLVMVLVDVVSPGKGLVTCGAADFSGSIIRDREAGRGYFVETEFGDVIGKARTYKDGAVLLAKHHGVSPNGVTVEVEFEKD
jgi:hypothetical protein